MASDTRFSMFTPEQVDRLLDIALFLDDTYLDTTPEDERFLEAMGNLRRAREELEAASGQT